MSSVTYSPPPPTEEQPYSAPPRVVRRRRSSRRRLTVWGVILRVLLVLTLAASFLIFWHGVAYTQSEAGTPTDTDDEGRFAFEPRNGDAPSGDAPASRPGPPPSPDPRDIPLRPPPLPVDDGPAPATEDVPATPAPQPARTTPPPVNRDALPRTGESLSDWLTRPGASPPTPPTDTAAPPAPATDNAEPPAPRDPVARDPAPAPEPEVAIPPVPSGPAGPSGPSGPAIAGSEPTPAAADVDPDRPAPLASPGKRLRGISQMDDRAIPWTSTLDLVLAYELEFSGVPPAADITTLRREFYHQLIELSVAVGHSDNPRENLDAVRQHVFDRMLLQAVERPEYPIELLRPSTILTEHRGSPTGVALVALLLADRLNPYLELEPVRAGDLIGLRYRSGMHRYILVPAHPDKLYSDREFTALAFGKPLVADKPVEVLTRRQLWGLHMGHTAAALLAGDERERARGFASRALRFLDAQSIGHLVQARLFLEDQDLAGAREEFDRAIALAPDSARARLERVHLLEATGGDEATVEEDLTWLSHHGKRPDAGLELGRFLLERDRYTEALAEVQRVQTSGDLPKGLRERAAKLRQEILSAPWIVVLLDPGRPAQERFDAVEELSRYPIPPVTAALAQAIEDPNLRLARFAWKRLQHLTGWKLPFDPDAWRTALSREERRQEMVGGEAQR